jgi:phage terminase small subunit
MGLTAKQEGFCQSVVSGKTQADAYRANYSTTSWKDNAIQVEASRLMDNPMVALRVTELRDELANKSLWTREQSVKVLAGVVDADDAKHTDRISAVKELNLMQGFNAPTKLDVNMKFPKVINVIAGRANG